MATQYEWTKTGLRLTCVTSKRALPKPLSLPVLVPDFSRVTSPLLRATLETVAASGRQGIRITMLGVDPLPNPGPWTLYHASYETAPALIPWKGVDLGLLTVVDYFIPDPQAGATHTFYLAGGGVSYPVFSVSTPNDLLVGITTPGGATQEDLEAIRARLDAIGADGVVSDDERPELRVMRASLSAQVVAAKAKADAMVPAMTYAALTTAWAAFTENVSPVIDANGNTAINTVTWSAWWSAVASELVALAGAMANKAQATGTSAKAVADAATVVLTDIANDGQLTDQERPGGVASLGALKGQWERAWATAVTRGVSAAVLSDMRDTVWKPAYSTIAGTLYVIPNATNYDSYGSVVIGARLTGTAALPAGYLTYLTGLHNVIIDLLNKTAAVPASAANPGVVKVGAGLTVDGAGVLSATATALPIATATVLGGIKGSASISIDPVTGIATANVGSGGGWTPGTALTATTGAFSGSVSTNGNIVLNATTSMITSWSRFGSATAGNILFNNGSGSNLVLAETATNVYTIGNAAQGAIPTNVLSINTSNGNISIGAGTLTAQAVSATTGTFSGTVTAPVSVIDHASEANIILKKGGAYAAGLYNSGTNLGLWDWANSRAIFQHNLAGNTSTFTPPVTFAGGITGNTTINSTGAILTLNNPLGGSSNNEIYFNGAGVCKYRIGSNITIGGYGAFEVYDHANSKLLASFAAGRGGLTLPGTNGTNNITLTGYSDGASSQRAYLKFSDSGYNNLDIGTVYPSNTNTITFTPGGVLALTISGSGGGRFVGQVEANGLSCAVNPTGTNGGLSLYGTSDIVTSYGIAFRLTSNWGTHGNVSGDWATYFTMAGALNRGWIFRHTNNANVASIDGYGNGAFTGELTAAGGCPVTRAKTGNDRNYLSTPANFSGDSAQVNSHPGVFFTEHYPTNPATAPAGATNGSILQFADAGGDDVRTQFFVSDSGNRLFFQQMWGGGAWKGWKEVYHTGNIEQSAAALMAVQAHSLTPQWVASLPALPDTKYPKAIWNATTSRYDGGMVCIISTKAMHQNRDNAWVAVGAGEGIFGKLVAGQASIASIGAGALEADLVMSTIIRTSGASKSMPGTRYPTGVYLSGPAFTTYYKDGTQDAGCHLEVEGNTNIGGCKAAVVANRITGNSQTWTPGTYYNYYFPEGITQVTIQGAGGGAGGQTGGTGAGIGGCAAAFVQGLMTVYPGVPYTLTVGSGGGAGASGGATTISWSGTDLGGNARSGSFTIPGGNLTTGGAATSVQNSGIVFPGLNTSQGHTQRMGQSIWGFLAGGAGGGLFSDSAGAENGGGCDFMIGGSAGAGFSAKGTGGGGGGSSPLGRGGNGGSWGSPNATAGGIGAGGGGGGYTSFGSVAGAGGAGGPGQLKIWW